MSTMAEKMAAIAEEWRRTMRDYSSIRKNLRQARKDLASLKKQMPLEEYLEEGYLLKQVCLVSVAIACLEESVEDYLAFEFTLDEEDRLLLLDMTGER